jgi:catechol 2,3-dioxygenase-like lactoylglutathione lyase family enzyme
MIHHLSVSAADPQGAAEFFADIMGGVVVDFPPNPGSFMVFKADGMGTAIEVYPAGTVMVPNGEPGSIFVRQPAKEHEGVADRRSPTHFALSVSMAREDVMAKAAAKGWETYVCDRGGHFHVIEVWIENTWLVEVLPLDFAAEYLTFADAVTEMADPNKALVDHQPQAKTLENA